MRASATPTTNRSTQATKSNKKQLKTTKLQISHYSSEKEKNGSNWQN